MLIDQAAREESIIASLGDLTSNLAHTHRRTIASRCSWIYTHANTELPGTLQMTNKIPTIQLIRRSTS